VPVFSFEKASFGDKLPGFPSGVVHSYHSICPPQTPTPPCAGIGVGKVFYFSNLSFLLSPPSILVFRTFLPYSVDFVLPQSASSVRREMLLQPLFPQFPESSSCLPDHLAPSLRSFPRGEVQYRTFPPFARRNRSSVHDGVSCAFFFYLSFGFP